MVNIFSGNALLSGDTKPSAILCVKHTWLPTCLNYVTHTWLTVCHNRFNIYNFLSSGYLIGSSGQIFIWIFLELFDWIQVGGLSSYLVSPNTLSNDFNKCQIFISTLGTLVIFGIACQIYCYARFCVTQLVSPKVPENPSGPLIDNFLVLPCVACGVACVKLQLGVDRWNSLDDPRVIGLCHCEVWGWPRH